MPELKEGTRKEESVENTLTGESTDKKKKSTAPKTAQSTKSAKSIKYEEKKSKKGLILGIFFILLITALVAVTIFNVGNIRDGYIIPALNNIPIVKNILPQQEEADPDSSLSKDELFQKSKQLEDDIETKDSVIKELNDRLESLNAEMIRLREIEAEQAAFRQQKEEFDSLVALNSPIDYKDYYESILPENAERLYREVITTIQADKETRTFAEYFESMKAKSAALILEEMILTDMDLVVLILKNIDSDQCSAILAAMDSANAASVSKQLSPP